MNVGRVAVGTVVAALTLALLSVAPASAVRAPAEIGELLPVPLDGRDIGLELLGGDGLVYAVTQDPDTGGGIVTRVTADGDVDDATASLTPTTGLTRAADGTLWLPLAEESALGATSDGALAAFDPVTLLGPTVPITPADARPGANSPAVADADGRVWAQAFVGVRLSAVAAGLDGPAVSVETPLALVSSQVDPAVVNPILLGPDGNVWLLGLDALTVDPLATRVRVTAVDADGVAVDVAPRGYLVGAAWLTEAGGEVWTVVIDADDGTLAALGVDPTGATQLLPTSLQAVDGLSASRPVADRRGRLWFTGVGDDGGLVVAEVDVRRGRVEEHDTGLQPFDGAATTVVPTVGGVVVAGLDDDGDLGFARVGTRARVIATDVQPFLNASSQERYPIVADGRGGVWAQAVDDDGDLVVVHARRRTATTTSTGLDPAARTITVGPRPRRDLWTQATDGAGQLVLVRVTRRGSLATYPTGYEPPSLPLETDSGPVSDGAGHLWFRATEADGGSAVLVRVTATRRAR